MNVMYRRPRETPLLVSLRNNIHALRALQDKRHGPRLARTPLNRNPSSAGSAEPSSPVNDRRPRRRSYERIRPHQFSPQSPLSPVSGASFDIPPAAPDAPTSPVTTSTSATTNTSRSAKSDAIQYHWIKEIFAAFETETPLPRSRGK